MENQEAKKKLHDEILAEAMSINFYFYAILLIQ